MSSIEQRSTIGNQSKLSDQSSFKMIRNAQRILLYIVLGVVALLMMAPFLAMISVSLQLGPRSATYPNLLFPSNPTFENYRAILRNAHIGTWFYNSFVVSFVGTTLSLFTATTAGYAFARMRFPLRTFWFWSFLAMLMIPGQVTLIPEYLLLSWLKWVNTYQALIIPGITSAFGTFLMRQYVDGIPLDFEEAARIDGANEWQIFAVITVPMLKPALATLGTLQFLNYWNDFLFPMVVTSQATMRTLPVGLATLQTPTGGLPEMLAGTTIALLPTIVVFLMFQRFFIRGITMSGLRG